MTDAVKKIVQQVVTVAKGAAAKVGVSFGTVLSKNPDGTVNVDPGDGGCVRILAPQNVKIGDKVPIGTEPPVGTVTSLEPIYSTIDAPAPCPVDPRSIPTKPILIVNAAGEERIASGGIENWVTDRDTYQGNGTGASCATWFGEKNTQALTNISGIIGGGGAVSSALKRKVVSSCPHTILYQLARTWLFFDLGAAGVPLTGVTTARLKLSVVSSTSSLNGESVKVLLSDLTAADVPISVAAMAEFDRSNVLGEFLMTGHSTGVGTYGLVCDLDLSGFDTLPSLLVLALVTGADVSGTPPPTPVSVTDNVIYGDFFNFYTHSTQGPPLLEVDVPLL